MDSVNQSLCLYHVVGGECSVLSSVSFLVVFTPCVCVCVFFFFGSKRFYYQQVNFEFPTLVDSGFYTRVDSRFQTSKFRGFRIPGFVTWRRHNTTIIASRGDRGKFGDTTGGTALTKKMWMVGWVRCPGH